MTPLLLATDHLGRTLQEQGRRAEAALVAGSLLRVGFAVFGPWPGLGAENQPISFAVFPVVAWAAFRLGAAGATAANALIAAIAVWGTLGGSGPFVQTSNESSFLFT